MATSPRISLTCRPGRCACSEAPGTDGSPRQCACGPGNTAEKVAAEGAEPAGQRERQVASELLVMLARERGRHLDFLRQHVRSGADAEDLLQQAMLQAAEHLGSLRDNEKVSAWFARIVRHTLADHHTQWATRQARLDQLAAEASEQGPEEVALCACSLGLMGQLQPGYREILRRVDLDDEALPDVAESPGISVNNATVRLHRARKALSAALLAHCGTSSLRACQDCGCEGNPARESGHPVA